MRAALYTLYTLPLRAPAPFPVPSRRRHQAAPGPFCLLALGGPHQVDSTTHPIKTRHARTPHLEPPTPAEPQGRKGGRAPRLPRTHHTACAAWPWALVEGNDGLSPAAWLGTYARRGTIRAARHPCQSDKHAAAGPAAPRPPTTARPVAPRRGAARGGWREGATKAPPQRPRPILLPLRVPAVPRTRVFFDLASAAHPVRVTYTQTPTLPRQRPAPGRRPLASAAGDGGGPLGRAPAGLGACAWPGGTRCHRYPVYGLGEAHLTAAPRPAQRPI